MSGRAALAALVVLGACAGPGAGGGDGLAVVASFAPLAEAAARIGGDLVEVRDLTPAGAEPHDLELTPRELDRIDDADLAIVLGDGFQPAVEEAAGRRSGPTLVVLAALDLDDRADPHVWLDPVLYEQIVMLVRDALVELADPGDAGRLRAGAAAMVRTVHAVDAEYHAVLATCRRDLLVTAHDAFGWLAARYGLRHEAIAGLSPEQEPDPARLADLADLVEREGVTTVFTETLAPPDLAETLAREAGVATAVLDPIEGFTPARADAGTGWASAMRANLDALAAALGCDR